MTHFQLACQVRQPPFVVAQQLVVRTFIADQGATFEQLVDDRRGELAAAFRRVEALVIEGRRDRRRSLPGPAQLGDAVQQAFEVAQLRIGGDGTNDLMLTLVPTGPTDRDVDDFAVAPKVFSR